MALYDFEWTDGFLGSKLTHYRWMAAGGKERGVITYVGNEVKFQNGFGAWLPMIYECDYDPNNSLLLDVRIEAGRL